MKFPPACNNGVQRLATISRAIALGATAFMFSGCSSLLDSRNSVDPKTERPIHSVQADRNWLDIAATAGGRIGFAALHVESGECVEINADAAFPMASTYKIPIAIQLLSRVDRGEISLADRIEVTEPDLRIGSELSLLLDSPPEAAFALRHLLDLSLSVSDNTAADLVLRAAGGPGAVSRRMRELGAADVRIDRDSLHVLLDLAGASPQQPPRSIDEFQRLIGGVKPETQSRTVDAFDQDPRDTTTPKAMALLLARLARGEALSPKSTTRLLAMMVRARGSARIRAALPDSIARPAVKSGTLLGANTCFVNDIGIITLPQDRGHLVIAAYIAKSNRPVAECESVIARLTKLAVEQHLRPVRSSPRPN